MSLEALKTELAKSAYAELLAAGNHSAVAELLNARTQPGLVPLWEIKKAVIEAGEWYGLVIASTAHENVQVRGAAYTAVDYINDSRFTNLDPSLPSTQMLLGALVLGGVMSQGLADTIAGLSANRSSIADLLGLTITETTIAQALEAA
jgi:hypothetical protein